MGSMKPISRCLIVVAILVTNLGVLFVTTSPVEAVAGKLFTFTAAGTSLQISAAGGGTGPISAAGTGSGPFEQFDIIPSSGSLQSGWPVAIRGVNSQFINALCGGGGPVSC